MRSRCTAPREGGKREHCARVGGPLTAKDIAFLTGASGFVGSAVARQLLNDGLVVRALVRRGSNRSNLKGLDVEVVEGDIRDAKLLQQAMQGARHVFHVAADYRLWAPDPAEIFATNVEGTPLWRRR